MKEKKRNKPPLTKRIALTRRCPTPQAPGYHCPPRREYQKSPGDRLSLQPQHRHGIVGNHRTPQHPHRNHCGGCRCSAGV